MAKHVRRHIGERKHKCEVCGKAFIEKQELKNHSKMHSNQERTTKKSNENNETIQTEEVPQLSSEVSTLSNNSNNSETNNDSALNQFRDSLVNAAVANETESEETNIDLTSNSHSSLLSLPSSLTTISLPSFSTNLCVPLSTIHPLTTINMPQTYQNIENTNSLDNTTLSFCEFQRSENNRTFYGNINASRSPPHQTNSSFFTSQSPILSISTPSNQYLNEAQSQQNYLHCSLCSGVFVTINNLREHLIDFHRVEAEKVIAMMY